MGPITSRLQRWRRQPPTRGRAVVCVLLCLACCWAAVPGRAAPGRSGDEGAGPVFSRLAAGFEAGDAGSLAALVHSEGLRVTGHSERSGEYSPSQAVYFFRNLFQSQRTLVFAFRRTQDDAPGGIARALADWKRRRIDSERVVEQQLVLVLSRDDGQWRLTEINMIR